MALIRVLFVLQAFSLSSSSSKTRFHSLPWISSLYGKTPSPKTLARLPSPPAALQTITRPTTHSLSHRLSLLSVRLSVCGLISQALAVKLWPREYALRWASGWGSSSMRVTCQHEETRYHPWAVNLQWESRPGAPLSWQPPSCPSWSPQFFS